MVTHLNICKPIFHLFGIQFFNLNFQFLLMFLGGSGSNVDNGKEIEALQAERATLLAKIENLQTSLDDFSLSVHASEAEAKVELDKLKADRAALLAKVTTLQSENGKYHLGSIYFLQIK